MDLRAVVERRGAGRATSSVEPSTHITPYSTGISTASAMPARSTYQHWLDNAR